MQQSEQWVVLYLQYVRVSADEELRRSLHYLPALLVLPNFYQTDGVWLAQPISDVISFVVAIVLLTKYVKKFKAAQAEGAAV